MSQCSQNEGSRSGQGLPPRASHPVPLVWCLLCSACLSYAPQENYLWLMVLGPAQHGPGPQHMPRKEGAVYGWAFATQGSPSKSGFSLACQGPSALQSESSSGIADSPATIYWWS